MSIRLGRHTIEFSSKPKILATHSIVGPKEGRGKYKEYYDDILKDDTNGKNSYEKAESSLILRAIEKTIAKAKLLESDIDYIFAGDLLNQLTSTNFAMREVDIPFFGLYGACSTMSESISLAAMIMDGNHAQYVLAGTSSHFSSAERQFRFPLEYGSQRVLTSQWTVTGSGIILLGKNGDKKLPSITQITTGKVKDYEIKDANNMGIAMVPAAANTILNHFLETGKKADYYDYILTGDLGKYGKEVLIELLKEDGIDISKNYIDCGDEIFNECEENICAGGSGCGCSAVVLTGYIYKSLLKGDFKKILLVSTGALLSTTSSLQGETIPGIAHAVAIEMI